MNLSKLPLEEWMVLFSLVPQHMRTGNHLSLPSILTIKGLTIIWLQGPGRTTRASSHSLLDLTQTMLPQQLTARTGASATLVRGLATTVPTASLNLGPSGIPRIGMRHIGRKRQGSLPQTEGLVHLSPGQNSTSSRKTQKKNGSDTTGLTVWYSLHGYRYRSNEQTIHRWVCSW